MVEMIRNQLVTMVQDTTASLITWTPRLLGGVVLLVVALVVAKVVAGCSGRCSRGSSWGRQCSGSGSSTC